MLNIFDAILFQKDFCLEELFQLFHKFLVSEQHYVDCFFVSIRSYFLNSLNVLISMSPMHLIVVIIFHIFFMLDLIIIQHKIHLFLARSIVYFEKRTIFQN